MIYILGNIGNLLSILIFLKKSWRKYVCVLYFLVCLVLNQIYLNSYILGFIFISGFNINVQYSNVILCKLFYYIPFLIVILFPNILILASIDRLLISSQNVDTRLYSSKRLAYFSISISTSFWMIFNFHLLIKVNLQEISPSVFVCFYDSSKIYFDFIYYSLLIINVLFWFIMVILCVFTFKNVRRIRIIPRQQRIPIRLMKRKDFQLLRCLFTQNIIYILVQICPNVLNVYRTATKLQTRTPLEQTINAFLNDLFVFITYISHWSNFFIFLIISKAFRHEIKRMIYKFTGRELNPIREEENVEINVVSTVVPPS
jgi:hypothetical protein